MSNLGNLGYREGEKDAPLIVILLIMLFVFIILPIGGIYYIFSWIKYENNHPIYYTYTTEDGKSGEAVYCTARGSFLENYAPMSCKLEDGTIIKVNEFKSDRR